MFAEPGAPIGRQNIHEPIVSPVQTVPLSSLNDGPDEVDLIDALATAPDMPVATSGPESESISRRESFHRLPVRTHSASFRSRIHRGSSFARERDAHENSAEDEDADNDLDTFMEQLGRANRDMDVADIREIMRRANYSPEQLSVFLSGAERHDSRRDSSTAETSRRTRRT